MMQKLKYFVVFCLLLTQQGFSQPENASAGVELQAGTTTNNVVPFWLRSNQFGSVPQDGVSTSLIGFARKDYVQNKEGLFDWGLSLEGRINAGNEVNFQLIEGMGKVRLGIFQFSAGREKQITGLYDSVLSTGSWSVSGNALGVPKVELAIPEFYSIPWFGKLFAFKGQFAHGWLGPITVDRPPMVLAGDTVKLNSYFHQKSFYGRLGKPEWKLKLYGGFNHQVFWGNEDIFYGDAFTLSPLETVYYVTVGKAYYNDEVRSASKVGNHLGSIDIGGEYTFGKWRFLIYRQNFYDVGNLYYLTNIRDGLNGLSIVNKNPGEGNFTLNRLVFEFLYTKSQAGQPGAKITPTLHEYYYNNYQYIDGWSYKETGVGTPFITSRNDLRENLPVHPSGYFANNRVVVYHVGLSGGAYKFQYVLKLSYSKNYGTYFTTDEEQSTGIVNPGAVGIFGEQNQFSAYADITRELNKKYSVGCLLGFDVGSLLYDSFGIMLKASRRFE